MKIIEWKDIDVVCRIDKKASAIDFELFEITGRGQDIFKNFTVNLYELKGATSSEQVTENLDEAQTLVRGTIKWDACSHVYFGDDDGYIHLCGGRNWKTLMTALDRVFKEASSILKEGHNDDMFDDN